MARPSKHDGVVYKRKNSSIWWMRYRDKSGRRRLESTNTENWDEAQKQMRARLASRDNNTLAAIRKGQQTTFNDWADFSLENYSKPPIRAAGTHRANQTALKNLRPMFGSMKLGEIDASLIEVYLRTRIGQRRRVRRGRTRIPATDNGAPGISSVAPDLQCGGQEKTLFGQPLHCRGVSRDPQRPFPTALHDLVRAGED